MDEEWIVVPNWRRFQHYKDRQPVWIKVYTELNSDPNWETLTLHQRGLLITIWIEYARSRGRVSVDQVRSWVGLGFKQATLKALSRAGFIALSASPETDSLLTETVKEAETEPASRLPISKPHSGKKQPATASLAKRLLDEIQDSNGRTRQALAAFEQRLPDAAFATALESLQHRRARTDRKPLASEARYVVATLSTMEREGQYGR